MIAMPRKKADPNLPVERDAESHPEPSGVEGSENETRQDDASEEHDMKKPGQNNSKRSVSKLDSLEFYRTQLKLEGLESDIAKTDREASEINLRILEIAKQEMNLEQKTSGTDAAASEEQLQKAREHIQELYKRLENTRLEKDALNHEIAQLRDDLTRTYHEDKISDYTSDQYFGTVVRISDDSFASSQFSDGRYEVRLARDGSYIKFKPDVQGLAICKNGSICLPLLPRLIPFNGTRQYGIIPVNKNTIMIRL